MKTIFSIAKYEKQDDIFIKTGYDDYSITYLKSNKWYLLRVVVNGYLTKETVSILNRNFRDSYLKAIKEYLEFGSSNKNLVVKKVSLAAIEQMFSKHIVYNVKNYLLPPKKENSRDMLTKYNLV